MRNNPKDTPKKNQEADPGQPKAPAISLPKGGGAIKGIDEKFTVNPATGTGTLNVPIFTSPGRSNFQPQLSLSYNSGTGNGPFGMGWDLSVPSITRKTDKGIPRYWDQEDSDTFILSGSEDLVPVLEKKDGTWKRKTDVDRVLDGKQYDILFFRPRIEGLFARIERWTNGTDKKDVFWRAITRDNITSIYGKSDTARISDSSDEPRIFKWLLERTYDDKGNIISYEYKPEDERRVVEDSERHHESWIHEKNRLANKSYESQRYLKHVRYGNKFPYYFGNALPRNDDYLFEVVFDYGDHTYTEVEVDVDGKKVKRIQCSHTDNIDWPCRPDPFSSYRSGFEIRTYRLCRRALMFHHFQELGNTPCLVRSTDFTYADNPVATKLIAATQTGYKRNANDAPYLFKSFPPIEFGYTEPHIDQQVRDVPEESLKNLPIGLDNNQYKWIDLDGEGISGILTEQGGGWFYKPNLGNGEFGPTRVVTSQPSLGNLAGGNQQFLDLAGDGQLDLVVLEDPITGFYERNDDFEWKTFKPFQSKPNINWLDPNFRFIDLNGDGHADILITEDELFVWYPSLEEAGYGEANSVHKVLDEEKGPAVVFADASESIYLADMSGDGLTDIVRIRNGEVCCWPNLGYGRFGAKVAMASPPFFDMPDQFDPKRIRLGDIDGTGTSDIFYLGSHVIRFWYNRSGNSWSSPEELTSMPQIDNLSSISVVDLLGHGTSCLVWSSPLPGDSSRPMRYIDLMGSRKPHLLVNIKNNLGAETKMTYAPSTKFYLEDKKAGKLWITRLTFPVHVVEKVETYDHISRNRFVTRYAYHHGFYDGIEREFRGFGRVDQWDTEEFATLETDGMLKDADNLDKASHVPPVLTKTWFHTGAYIDRDRVSRGFEDEYYREPGLTVDEARDLLLPDTVLPDGITNKEEREACRSLKGSMLRQEVYAIDGPGTEDYPHGHPYTVNEQNFTIRPLQPVESNKHCVYFTHRREAINYHYERNPEDPRVSHALTLEVDRYGNVLKSASIAYGRRKDSDVVEFSAEDRKKQRLIHITCTENTFTKPYVVGIDASDQIGSIAIDKADAYRAPLPAESRTYELRKPQQEQSGQGQTNLFQFNDVLSKVIQAGDGEHDVGYEDLEFIRAKEILRNDPEQGKKYFRRLIEHVRTLFRPNKMGLDENDPFTLLPLGTVQSLALPGETYKLAFTPGLLSKVFQSGGQTLLTNPADVLAVDMPGNVAADHGGYVNLDNDGHWWIPSGRVFHSLDSNNTAAEELAYARQHFFLPHRYRDPFHTSAVSTESVVTYDDYDLLMLETRDALNNRVTVGERTRDGTIDPTRPGNDYRVLQPRLVADPNGNRTEVVFDALGMVSGTAVMGKPEDDPQQGDYLGSAFLADLHDNDIDAFYDTDDPHALAENHLKTATTHIIYDTNRFYRTRQAYPEEPDKWEPVFAATLSRETHVSDLTTGDNTKIQISFSYSDGFGREIQKKIQAEPENINGVSGPMRWVGSGWTIFNNKGKPVRQYEPFFSQLTENSHRFEFGMKVGVSTILFYDPLERVVVTLHPNHTYEKVRFDPWYQKNWDVNDTVTFSPDADEDVKGFLLDPNDAPRIPSSEFLPTWYDLRTDADKALQKWPDTDADGRTLPDNAHRRAAEKRAAERAAEHAETPTVDHFDTLGRAFLTIADNGRDEHGDPQHYLTRLVQDIEGNQREVIDARDLVVMRYAYDMLSNQICQDSMDAGKRWLLNDVSGNAIRAWDSRGHRFRTEYDTLRRPARRWVIGEDTQHSDARVVGTEETLFEQVAYGEDYGDGLVASEKNLLTCVWLQKDAAGVVTNEAYDFKGNLLRASRRLAEDYKGIQNWSGDPALEDESFSSSTRYDALNRPIQLVAPHSDRTGSNAPVTVNVIRPGYNEANLLEGLDVWLELSDEPTDLLNPATASTHGVVNIDYNAKGQRTRIEYKNDVTTTYSYDEETFRLVHLETLRPNRFRPYRHLAQDLHYTYDPVGNITTIRDQAQHRVFHNNNCVDAGAEYKYDAIYRLLRAKGREHRGQDLQPNWDDAPRSGNRIPNDCQALRNYVEIYRYDAVGNIMQMVHHQGGNLESPGQVIWNRRYQYLPNNNRLLSTSLPSDTESAPNYATTAAYSDKYDHDIHGNMIDMPHLSLMSWDFEDQLLATARQQVNDPQCDPEMTYYVYDASGQRVRKVTKCFSLAGQQSKRTKERIYLNGFEIYREYNSTNGNAKLERETLHIMDDKQRTALVETRTIDINGDDQAPRQLVRYQYGNHLGSAVLELDDQAQVISYEEYYSYGGTAYQAARNQTETPKRYRYSGKERDEETGLYYYGARYYTAWLGRWASCDPIGIVDGVNRYQFVSGNPTSQLDRAGLQGGPVNDIEHGVIHQSWDPESAQHGGCPTPFDYSYNPYTEEETQPTPTDNEIEPPRLPKFALKALGIVGDFMRHQAVRISAGIPSPLDVAAAAGAGSLISGGKILAQTGKGAIVRGAGAARGAIVRGAGAARGAVVRGAGAARGAIVRGAGAARGAIIRGAGAIGTTLTTEVTAGTAVTAGVTATAIVAAVTSLALAGETVRAAVSGEKTPIEVVDEYYGISLSNLSPEQSSETNIYDYTYKAFKVIGIW